MVRSCSLCKYEFSFIREIRENARDILRILHFCLNSYIFSDVAIVSTYCCAGDFINRAGVDFDGDRPRVATIHPCPELLLKRIIDISPGETIPNYAPKQMTRQGPTSISSSTRAEASNHMKMSSVKSGHSSR